VFAGALGIFLLSFLFIPFMGTEFFPSSDQEMLIIKLKMPVGTSMEETDRVMQMAEDLLSKEPTVEIISAQTGSSSEENAADSAQSMNPQGSHEGLLWVGLVDQDERDLSDLEILEKIRGQLPKLKGVRFESIDMGQMMMGGSSSPIEIKLFGKDLLELKKIADVITDRIRDVEGLRDVTHSFAEGKPEYQIAIDRERASRLGLTVGQVANTVQTVTLGRVATQYRVGDDEFDVRVKFSEDYRDDLQDIRTIPIMSPVAMVQLDQVARIVPGEGPIQINRENQSRVVTVSANIAGRDLGSVMKDIITRVTPLEKTLPSGYFIEYSGQYEDMQEAFMTMIAVVALATLLVYMIMASQFESFKHPMVIMFTIPLALIGVVFALFITGTSISLVALIGFVILSGIAVNNGIVMVDYINQLRRGGMDTRQAILEGSAVRLRPVLITALTTIMGMVPMAVSTSAGSQMRAPMAVTVIGGLVATTILTLFVVPAIYSLFERVSFKMDKPKT
jgi:HAE1 family hydrophobic/amphiphilic exporter-1